MSSTRDRDEAAVVRVDGEVDLASAGDFGARLARAISEGNRTVVIDLTEVAFMDSAGVNTILNARALADRVGVRVIIRRPDGEAGRILDMLGL